jgi:hypothetical protein
MLELNNSDALDSNMLYKEGDASNKCEEEVN